VSCGIKRGGALDLCLLQAEVPCAAAGTFTRNAFKAAPVVVTMEHLSREGVLQAVVANSGVANAWTGERGRGDARAMAGEVGRLLGIPAHRVAVASTGTIGNFLPMEKVLEGIRAASWRLTREGGEEAARAIMTTDSFPKLGEWDCGPFRVGGMAKGAGMIHPDMATMLAFITTDALVEPGVLSAALRAAVEKTFNRITVDGCTSTNDMVLALASGLSGYRPSPGELEEALLDACRCLSRLIVRDGEGASRLMRVRVEGARDDREAKAVAFAVAGSLLVKTALFGGDPNWGRIVQAVGAALPDAREEGTEVLVGDLLLARDGVPAPYPEDRAAEAFSREEVEVTVRLSRGEGVSEVLTCDLGYEYVRINAEYRT
jgi:glutamate N-acetyltransferase/amino-acid N-acetyltransferase